MSDASRQLVAIMFTDIVGYTSLMGEDEQKAHSLLDKNRKLQKPLVKSYGGKWIKEIGDGVLATFSTVSDAVYCAAAIQQETKDDADLNLRIGIHQGEVVFQDDDVFGDGVNIASRLESLAPTGGIWVSEAVSRNIQNKHGIQTLFVREEQLKNVKDPVKIYEIRAEDVELPEPSDTSLVTATKSRSSYKAIYLTLAVISIALLSYWGYRQFYTSTPDQIEDVTIAVLAFDYQSSEDDQAWLGVGFPGVIRDVLTKVKGLKVTGKTSSFSFKDKEVTTTEIGKILKVNTLLEGSVSKVGNELRITASLIDAESGLQLWGDQYHRNWGDINSIMDEVAENVVTALKIELSLDDMKNIKIGYQGDPAALEYYLKGEYLYWDKYVPIMDHRDFIRAEEMYTKAIKLDSAFSDAYAGLATLYDQLGDQLPVYKLKRDSVLKLARTVSPNSASLLSIDGWRYMDANKNIDSALYFFMKAHNIEPNNQAHSLAIIHTLTIIGLYHESNAMSKKLLDSDPLNLVALAYFQWGLQSLGEYDLAKEQLIKSIEIEPLSIWSYKEMIEISIVKDNNLIEAHRIYEIAQNISSDISLNYEKALILAAEGRREEALSLRKSLSVYSILNMKEEAIHNTDSMTLARNYTSLWTYLNLKNDKATEFIRDEPEFQKILARAKIVHEERVAKYGHLFDE